MKIEEECSRSLSEYLLLPELTKKTDTPDSVDLSAYISRYRQNSDEGSLSLRLPIVSAIMQSVSGSRLSIALAKEGGLSFVFQSQEIEAQAEMISRVKGHKAGFVRSGAFLSPGDTMENAVHMMLETGHSTIPVTSGGMADGQLEGVLTDKDFPPDIEDLTANVMKYATLAQNLKIAPVGISLREAYQRIWQEKLSVLLVGSQAGVLDSMVFRKDYEEGADKINQSVDNEGRLLVGAGINTRDYKERVPALLDAKADILCIDSSDGYTEWVQDTLRYIKQNYGDTVKVGAGNVVDAKAFHFLADAGADFVKIGIGPGSICITRKQKGIGRGQASALMDVAAARDRYLEETGVYVPICSDGGITNDYEITIALALGADFVMMGRYFAAFDESPTEKVLMNGTYFKEYWAEGSNRANNWARYDVGGSKSRLMFEEGVEGYVPYAGELSKGLSETVAKVKSTFSNCGSVTIAQLRETARLVAASPASMQQASFHTILVPDSAS
jgi:IMP dehydrogenase